MMAVPHIGFIVAAYGLTMVVLSLTVLVLIRDQRTQKRLLARLTERDRP